LFVCCLLVTKAPAQFLPALAHPVRIRILEILVRGGTLRPGAAGGPGACQPIVAQQLAILRNQNIVVTQKQRLSVRYTLRHPLVGDLLDVARRIFNNQLVSTRGLLRELQRESRRSEDADRSGSLPITFGQDRQNDQADRLDLKSDPQATASSPTAINPQIVHLVFRQVDATQTQPKNGRQRESNWDSHDG